VTGSPCVIEYRGRFSFERPPSDVWRAMEQFERFESWWSWLREFRVEGPGLMAGSVLHGLVVPPLPYRLHVRVALLACDPARRIDAALHGDVEGRAELLLEPERQGTLATVSSAIEVMQRPMRIAARLAPPVLRWGHDRVVDATVASFRRHLGSSS
jgi:carbon monoxide dehydrogenase subunit G